jgi:hypothetical protein
VAKVSEKTPGDLREFQGRKVVGVKAKLSVGNAIQQMMDVTPIEFDGGETVVFVVKTTANKFLHEPATKGNYEEWVLVQDFIVELMAPIDDELVAETLERMADRIREAELAKSGQTSFDQLTKDLAVDGDDGEDDDDSEDDPEDGGGDDPEV